MQALIRQGCWVFHFFIGLKFLTIDVLAKKTPPAWVLFLPRMLADASNQLNVSERTNSKMFIPFSL